MNGSSCPRCGWVLRWLPEQGAWGCDRCRMVVPAQQLAPPGQPVQGAPYAPPGQPMPGAPYPPPGQPMQGAPYAPPGQPMQGAPYAPPPHGGPAPAPYSPHAAPPGPGYPVPAPRPRSSKGLIIGLGVGAVVVAGTIVGIVLARGGGSGSGVGSRDDLVKRTLAAVSEGDVEKLVKLSDPVGLYNRALDCSERDKGKQDKDADKDAAKDADAKQDKGADKDPDKDPEDKQAGDGEQRSDRDADDTDDDPQIQEKRVRRKHEKLVDKTKGTKIELISIVAAGAGAQDGAKAEQDGDAAKADGDGKRAKGGSKQIMKKGDKAPSGCVFKVDVELHELVAKIRVTPPDGKAPSEGEAKLLAVDAGGSWFLWTAPTISGGAGALAEKLREYKDRMCACKDAACTEDVHKEMKDWSKTVRDEAKSMPKDDQKTLDEIDDEMKACRRKIREGDEAAAVKEALAKLEGFKDKVCVCADAACVERVEQEMLDFSKSLSQQAKDAKPTPDDEQKVTEIMKELTACRTKVMAGTGATPSDDPMPPEDTGGGTGKSGGTGTSSGDGASGGTGISSVPECAEYRRQIDKMRTCRKYPSTAVDSLKQGFEQLERSWASIRSNAAAREQMTKACQASADALKKARQSICP